jgi:hypothetical protein
VGEDVQAAEQDQPLWHHRAVTEGDWRLMGQQTWLAGRELRWADWTAYRPGWDHDHCAFCQAEFAAAKTDHVEFTAGYVTADDGDTWICEACFEDFKDQFQWRVVSDPAQP